MAKLKTVIKHEYMTIVKQPSFWIVMLAIPLLIATVIGLSYIGNKSSEERIKDLAKDLKNVAIIDRSGLINQQVVQAAELQLSSSSREQTLRDEVRREKKEALIVYPDTLQSMQKYEIYLSSD
mgnify:FL=1